MFALILKNRMMNPLPFLFSVYKPLLQQVLLNCNIYSFSGFTHSLAYCTQTCTECVCSPSALDEYRRPCLIKAINAFAVMRLEITPSPWTILCVQDCISGLIPCPYPQDLVDFLVGLKLYCQYCIVSCFT